MNPFFRPMQTPMQQNNPMNMLQRFNEFRNTFRGDPQRQVQQLLQSGRMTQQQFEQYKNTARQMMQMFR